MRSSHGEKQTAPAGIGSAGAGDGDDDAADVAVALSRNGGISSAGATGRSSTIVSAVGVAEAEDGGGQEGVEG